MSLFIRLQSFPGEKGMGADPPNPFEVTLMEFPTTPEELDEVLETIQTWLNEVGLEAVTVYADARTYELHRAPGS